MMNWVDISPLAVPAGLARNSSVEFADRLVRYITAAAPNVDEAEIEVLKSTFLRSLQGVSRQDKVIVTAYVCVLADLAKQGWRLRTQNQSVDGLRPQMDAAQAREGKRRQLAARRNEQLREAGTREFVYRMERGHIFGGGRVSIFSLMRDGRGLAGVLSRQSSDINNGEIPLRPYVQIAERPATCELTGFELFDIWRYFRHTWSTPHESIPGRTMPILVRDGAAPFHPIIGIAALSSAASVLPVRDSNFIRWSAEAFIEDARRAPATRKAKLARWMDASIGRAISELYRQDFVEDGLISSRLPSLVSEDVINALREEGKTAKSQHFADTRNSETKISKGNGGADDAFWETQARSPLFRAKRATELADLLLLRNSLRSARQPRSPSKTLDALLASSAGRKVIGKIVRKARSQSMGSAIADLTVCGAVAPYNELIGGKLVALLSVSPQIALAYKERYSKSASVIGSSMAGRRVVRRADLVFVGTTSLYGIRPNQYDRAVVPRQIFGAPEPGVLGFRFLGNTEGYGTSQFGEATKEALENLSSMQSNGRGVNNLFGEGANPRLRALRDGLKQLNLPDELLVHGLSKSVYGVSLVEPDTLRDYLLGITKSPRYVFPVNESDTSTEVIAKYWYSRWVLPRLQRPETLERISSHTLIHPIRHGARLRMPEADIDQLTIFGLTEPR